MIPRFRSIILIIIALLITPVPGQTIKIKQDGNEKWLVDQNDLTLYYLLSDGGNEISTCYEGCLENWIPFDGNVIDVSSNLRADDFDRITRRDGTSQIMYKGWPLYTYRQDTKAGDKLGVGGLWDIINPDRFPPY